MSNKLVKFDQSAVDEPPVQEKPFPDPTLFTPVYTQSQCYNDQLWNGTSYGLQRPAPAPVFPLSREVIPEIFPQDEELKKHPVQLLKEKIQPYSYVDARENRKYENEFIAWDCAENLLAMLVFKNDLRQLQRYFGNGAIDGFVNVVISCYEYHYLQTTITVTAQDLWNYHITHPVFQIDYKNKYGVTLGFLTVDLRNVWNVYTCWPYLLYAICQDCGSVSREKMNAMARRICEDAGVDPDAYPENRLYFPEDSPIQFSALTEQNSIFGGIPFRGEGGQIRYYLQRLNLIDVKEREAYVPICPLCVQGIASTRPSYVLPENPIFYRQDEILGDEFNRVIYMTSQLSWAFDVSTMLCPECIVTTAWRLDACLETDGALPWYVFRGKVVHYVLICTSESKSREFDLAVRVCKRIEESGSGHAKVIVVLDGEVWEEEYSSDNFWKLRDKLNLKDADLHGYMDLADRPVEPGGDTAIPYIKAKNLILVLGEPKAGKTSFTLYMGWKLANLGPKPGLVIYCYGEGEPSEIDAYNHLVDCAMKKKLEIKEGHEGRLETVDLSNAFVSDGGCDLKRPEHREYLKRKIQELRQKNPNLPLVSIILDNYASLMGQYQEGNAAIPPLNFCKEFQEAGAVVLLVCHTNDKGEVAGSSHLKRRANGIISLLRIATWQLEIKNRLEKAAGKCSSKTPLDNCVAEIERGIDEEEQNRVCPTLHVSFEAFRGQRPLPEEIVIDRNNKEIREEIVTPEFQKKFAGDYYEKLKSTDREVRVDDVKEDVEKVHNGDIGAASIVQEQRDGLPSWQQIMTMKTDDEQKEAFRQVVSARKCQTRADLAEALGITQDTLKNFMKNKISNAEIGLQNRVGRPKSC